ncbi:MAG: alpha/beta fold hydrolase, partial [Candidatus Brocadiae bacterium]|nr:alpha/beta fold hydrolase [Candidatus Brocadiia bacterium]
MRNLPSLSPRISATVPPLHDTLSGSGTDPAAARSACGGGLRTPHADPGRGHPARADRTGYPRLRADGDGEDGGVRAADPAAALRGTHPHPARRARTGPRADPRARDPDRGALHRLREIDRPALDRHLRRHGPGAAGPRRPGRPRCDRGHPGAASRPHGPDGGLPRNHPLPRPRRGRPHAGHGLPPGRPPDPDARPASPPDDALQRDAPPRNPRPGAQQPPRPGQGGDLPVLDHRGTGQAAGRARRDRAETAGAGKNRVCAWRHEGARVHADQGRREPGGGAAEPGPLPGGCHARRPVAERPREVAGELQEGRHARPGRDGHRLARAGCGRRDARDQLRRAGRAGGLRAPDRPDGARRGERDRDHPVRAGRTAETVRDRKDDPDGNPRRGRFGAAGCGPAASRERRTCAPDLPGFGESGKPLRARYGFSFFCRWLVGFLDALLVDKASLVGNSMGGRISLEVGLRHPERVDKLVLLAPSMAWRSYRQLAPLARLLRPEMGLVPIPLLRAQVLLTLRSLFVTAVPPAWIDAAVDEFLHVFSSP